MAFEAELSGVSIVGAGNFNPAIFQPQWLEAKGIISSTAAKNAQDGLVVTPDLTAFTADWLTVQVGLQQLVIATVDEGRDVDVRDVAQGILSLLPETPMDAFGVNADAHFRIEDEAEWHALGDRLAPKELWEPIFASSGVDWKTRKDGQSVGLRTMTVETHREEPKGYVRLEVGPSVRVTPQGIYIGINTHFQLTTDQEQRANAFEAARVLGAHWEDTRMLEQHLVGKVMANR